MVLDAMLMPKVPAPVILLMVTVRLSPVLLSILTLPLAVPVLLRVISLARRVLLLKLSSP